MKKPACVGCGLETADRQHLFDAEGHSLGLVCERCHADGIGYQEAVFHAFGGKRASHGDEAREPYYLPTGIHTFAELKAFAMETVRKNPTLRVHLNPPPPTRALVKA